VQTVLVISSWLAVANAVLFNTTFCTFPRQLSIHFQPNPQYIREMKKYAILPATFDPTKNRLDNKEIFHACS